MRQFLYKNNEGQTLRLQAAEVGQDLTGADITDIKIEKPNGTGGRVVFTKNATIIDQIFLEITFAVGDLDQPGEYLAKTRVEKPPLKADGDLFIFDVFDEFGGPANQ